MQHVYFEGTGSTEAINITYQIDLITNVVGVDSYNE